MELTEVGDCSSVVQVKERGVHDLGSTRQPVTLGLTHSSIRSTTKTLGFEELNVAVGKLSLSFSHVSEKEKHFVCRIGRLPLNKKWAIQNDRASPVTIHRLL